MYFLHGTRRYQYSFLVRNVKDGGPSPYRREFCSVHPDYQFIRTQLDICKETHVQGCKRSIAGEHTLRVIDCKSRQLTIVKPGEPYVCLSYVWGSSSTQDVKEFGNKLPASVPKTVEDAMAVAINLGIPYLWVDRHCIDQGNNEEKHRIIRNMNKIYEQAEVTIIAAIGDDPHHGLPGVQGTLREKPCTIETGGVTFVLVEDTQYEINKTKWSRRGWTYQEMLLSRRRLVFTKTQMYFRCRNAICMESLNPGSTDSQTWRSFLSPCFPLGGIGISIHDLFSRLQEYYRRELSFDTDSVLAFDSVFNAFDELDSLPFRVKHFYGVPVLYYNGNIDLARKSFISNLCWYLRRDKYTPSESVGRKNVFPSWSWASAKASHLQGQLIHPDSLTRVVHHDDIEILLTNKGIGKESLCAFFEHPDSQHELFPPSIEMTTWVLQYPSEWTHRRLCERPERTQYFEFEPREGCHTLHLAYLGAFHIPVTNTWIATLILEEIRPGIFHRVGLWRPELHCRYTAGTTSNHMLVFLLQEMKMGKYGNWWLPHEEVMSEIKWERRSFTLV